MAGLLPRYTAEEVRQFDDPRLRFEVIRGELYVTPAPGTPHQRAVGELYALLRSHVDGGGLGEVMLSPFEVLFSEDTAVQPDLLVILNDRERQLTQDRFLGPPSVVIEVISYSSKRTDRLAKRALYQEEGVTEYWIFDPGLRRVERWRQGAPAPELLTTRLTWQPPAGPAWELDLAAFFQKINR